MQMTGSSDEERWRRMGTGRGGEEKLPYIWGNIGVAIWQGG